MLFLLHLLDRRSSRRASSVWMEVERRNLGSDNDLREKRKKKPWSLPLAAFLSFNDRDVHPGCPNASNVFHKCGRHCVDKIPSRKFFMDALTSEEDWEKKSEKRGKNFICPNASNPYHKCAEYCFEKLPEKRQSAGINQPAMKPKRENKGGFTTNRLVKPECKNASNPYHVCDEYCLENVPERVQPGQVIRLKSSREVKKELRNEVRTGSLPLCKHASNPYHECSVLCFQIVPDNNLAKGDNTKGASTRTNKSIVRHSLEHASGRFHKANDYCLEDTPEMDHHKGEPKEERTLVCPKCKYASNPQHECTKFCIQNVTDSKITMRENLGGVSITADKSSVHQGHKNLSNPHYRITGHSFEDTFIKEQPIEDMNLKDENLVFTVQLGLNSKRHNASNPVDGWHGEAFMKSKEDNRVHAPPESERITQCKNASNPYHVCAEYCLQVVPKGHQLERGLTKSKEEKMVSSPLRVNSKCPNASNPYHLCDEYCFENVLERDQPGKTIIMSKKIERAVLPPEVAVNPDCKFASNPYHKCAETCFQIVPEKEQHRQVIKLKNPKVLKGSVSNKKITSGPPQCSFASNPYHECAEYCFTKNMSNSNIPDGVMKTNVKKQENKYSLGKDVNPNCKDASNPSHICHEYCLEGIRTEIAPKEEVEGIKAEVVEMKNLDEPKDDPPLKLAEASDLFHEWAKYCSQKNDDDDDEENLVRMGELSTRTGKGSIFLSQFESPKLEKVQRTRGFPRSLPISLLFFLGFIFAMVSWTQVIHSLVMSSEKNQGRERRKAEGDGENSCSGCYFEEFGESMH